MTGILEWGHDFINWLQQFSPALDLPFKAITTLGAEQAFLLLLPLIFWCVDKRRGARLSLLLMLSTYVNYGLKTFFDQPRPTVDRVRVLAQETSPGLPSGHSQNSVVFYGYLAAWVRRPRAWVAAGLVALAVGLSRIYLGVHFPSDVLAGWLVGGLLLALYLGLEPEVAYRLRPWPWRNKLILAVALPLILFLLRADEHSAQVMGVLLGLLPGTLIELRWVGFSALGPLWLRAWRFLVGSVVLVGLWLGTKIMFPTGAGTTALLLRLMRYTLVGAWASLGAPWLFVRSGLAPREREAWE